LVDFVKRSLSGGETVSSLVAHAMKYDQETARLLEEIGQELGAI
jgi:hypothetical protein